MGNYVTFQKRSATKKTPNKLRVVVVWETTSLATPYSEDETMVRAANRAAL